jgi:serine protease
LCAVKVLGADGSGTLATVIAGINHVLSKCSVPGSALCVANMSLGGGKSNALNKAVAAAVNGGIVMVVAAGNESYDACYSSPASEPLAITVGSTTISDSQSWFSNYGLCVDIYAPGSDITSSIGTSPNAVATYSGTSMASPRKYLSMHNKILELCFSGLISLKMRQHTFSMFTTLQQMSLELQQPFVLPIQHGTRLRSGMQ